jgi:hypothetical protein
VEDDELRYLSTFEREERETEILMSNEVFVTRCFLIAVTVVARTVGKNWLLSDRLKGRRNIKEGSIYALTLTLTLLSHQSIEINGLMLWLISTCIFFNLPKPLR